MTEFLYECLGLLVRWLHVVAAIAWIGESFYFVMLDRALKPPKTHAPGVFGELWSVHGGGFYHNQKYLVSPAQMPSDLHWSKWKSYTTWLSGFALFLLLYLRSPQIYLIDPAVADLTPLQGSLAAIAILGAGWILYDLMCRAVGFRDQLLGILVALMVLGLCYAATHLFAGRAAFLLVGAVLGTIMSANVFFVIIPGQKRMVATLSAGGTPDPLPGKRAKQRSVHNTYFTLPVVFAMMSNHYAPAHAHEHSWLLLALFMGAGALIRQFFVVWHSGERAWWLLGAGGAVLVGAFTWLAPRPALVEPTGPRVQVPVPTQPDTSNVELGPAPETAALLPIFARHCGVCHSAKPTLMPSAPLGVMFETVEQIDTKAQLIHQQVVALKLMPPGNLTQMTDQERAAIGRWFEAK